MKVVVFAWWVGLLALLGVAAAQELPIGDDLDAPVELPADGLVGALTDPLVRLRARPIGDGWAFEDQWTALHLRLDNLGEALSGELVVRTAGSSGEEHVHRRIVELAAGARRELSLPILAGRRLGEVQVDFIAGRRSASTRVVLRILRRDDVLIGVIGDDAAGLPSITGATIGAVPDYGWRPEATRDEERTVRVGLIAPRGLPDRAYALRGFSQLVWIDPDPSALTPGQFEALRHHVADGGHLVITTTERWRQLAGSPLADLLPARPIGLVDGGGASSLGASLAPVPHVAAPMAELRPIARPGRETVVLAAHQGAPTWVIGTHGLGTVTVVGLDPRIAPLNAASIPPGAFWRAILHLPEPGASSLGIDARTGAQHARFAAHLGLVPRADDREPPGRGLTHAETELVRDVIRDIPGVEPIPLAWLIGFSGLYLLLIGPVDYLVLRALRREILTWITFPVMIVVFSGLALIGITWFKGTQAVVTRVAFVDALPGTDLWRGDALYGLWATQRAAIDLRPGFAGGLASPVTEQGYLLDPSFRGDLAGDAARFVVQTWALGHARTSWMAPRTGELRLIGDLEDLTVQNDLLQDLDAVAICEGVRVVAYGSVAAGARATLNPGSPRLDQPPQAFDPFALLDRTCSHDAANRARLTDRGYPAILVGVTRQAVEPFELRGLDPEPINLTVLRFPVLATALPEESRP